MMTLQNQQCLLEETDLAEVFGVPGFDAGSC